MFTLEGLPGTLLITEARATYKVTGCSSFVEFISYPLRCSVLLRPPAWQPILLTLSDQHDVTDVLEQYDILPCGHMVQISSDYTISEHRKVNTTLE